MALTTKIALFGAIPVYSDISKIKETPDVIVDFSHVHATLEILKFAKNKHIPIVIATTGFNMEQEKIIKTAAGHIWPAAVLYSYIKCGR